MKIAVDAMGGDHAPRTEVEGAIRAARTLGVGIILLDDLVFEAEQGLVARRIPDFAGLQVPLPHPFGQAVENPIGMPWAEQ